MSHAQASAQPLSFVDAATGFALDISGMRLGRAALQKLAAPLAAAHVEMQKLEAGAIKNPDEKRKVTHFTDRLTYTESDVFRQVEEFACDVAAKGEIDHVLINGIGGSALGPQFLQMATNGPYWNELPQAARRGFPKLYFVDNTDPAGLVDALAAMDLRRSLIVTISKSGATQEPKNNLIVLEAKYREAGLAFAPHAVAVTMPGSDLDRHAHEGGWGAIFPMADSIGGRTSETNVVGHVPAALAGIDFAQFVAGGKHMDELTRREKVAENPAYLLAAAWHIAGHGRGDRNMVIVPYADRLVLFGKYLQQLVMESLGKEKDLDDRVVHQGLTVFGNKGGTDAHAFIQQLNDGRDDFFATFIEVLKDAAAFDIAGGLTMGDYLHGFEAGLVRALRTKNRRVIEITVESLNPFTLGMLIALYERVVAVYAELIHINAFNQPGVEAYKKASREINAANLNLQAWLETVCVPWSGTAAAAARAVHLAKAKATVAGLLDKFAVNGRCIGGRRVTRTWAGDGWCYGVEAVKK